MAGDVIVDLRNVWDPVAMRQVGFRYSSIGRP
jgi:UDPglucose 6-dehydrogenase